MTDIILSELNTIRKIIDSYSLDRKSSAEPGDKVNKLSAPVQNQNLSDLVSRIDGYQKTKGENSSFHQNLAVKTEVGSTMLTQSAELEIFMLGKFSAYQDNQLIKHWANCKSKQIFKYLVLHRGMPTHKEVLMDLFWPNLSENRHAII